MGHVSQEALAQRLDYARTQVEVGGHYAHYKHPEQSYEVTGVAITEADDEACVIYCAEYGERITFVRALASWLETVAWQGQEVPRFQRIA